jgi:IPT/TIG domain
MRFVLTPVVLLASTCLGCSQANRKDAPAPSGPAILSLSPTEGPAGTAYPIKVTITGTGFASEGNTVTFADISIPDLASTESGTRITFFAPKERPSTGEVPPFVFMPGEYRVAVTTPRGTSNTVNFTLTRGPV